MQVHGAVVRGVFYGDVAAVDDHWVGFGFVELEGAGFYAGGVQGVGSFVLQFELVGARQVPPGLKPLLLWL